MQCNNPLSFRVSPTSHDNQSLIWRRTPEIQDTPPDPWRYIGPKGLYHLSNYREPSVRISSFGTFIVTCMGDIVHAIAQQGFKPDEPYPDGEYDCRLEYSFPSGSAVRFELRLNRVAAPSWLMTFEDISEDLEALYYASLWFESQVAAFPETDIEIYRYRSVSPGPTFLASKGSFAFNYAKETKTTSTTL